MNDYISGIEVLELRKQSRLNVSKMGYEFDIESEVWTLDGSCSINWSNMLEMSETTFEGCKKTFSRMAEEMAAKSVSAYFFSLKRFLLDSDSTTITIKAFAKFQELNELNVGLLGKVRSIIFAWFDWGFAGVDKTIVDYLDELVIGGAEKGRSVKTRCPYSGPYTKLEQSAILEWSTNAFSNRAIDLPEFTFLLTLMLTGRRPIQLRHLRIADLQVQETKSSPNYSLRIPRAKQKQSTFRSEFREMPINEDLYLLLKKMASNTISLFEKQLGFSLSNETRNELPLFPAAVRVSTLDNLKMLIDSLDRKPDYFHLTSQSALAYLQKICWLIVARSERTGDFIHVTARRFRYTKGTNLAARGITGNALAFALDHTDTQNVDAYVQNNAKNAEYIDEAMSVALAPLAQAFAGTLIDSERDAIRAKDPNSRIKNNQHHNVGSCGTYSFCSSGYRACYTCCNFQPWREAPHEEVRNQILEEKRRQIEANVSANVIQSTDRLLLAVEQVISMCTDGRVLNE